MKKGRKPNKWHIYKKAFDDIIGDPYAWPEPVVGQYEELRGQSSIVIIDPEPKSGITLNPARPNSMDFFIDVDNAINDGLDIFGKTWREPNQVKFVFDNTYFMCDNEYYVFNQHERSELEQVIGRILVARSIAPAKKYFTTIKR